ncbi:MAG: hypothetical protein AAGE52_16735 [Myxococcota bacterium]
MAASLDGSIMRDALADVGPNDAVIPDREPTDAAVACLPRRWPERPSAGGREGLRRSYALRDLVLDGDLVSVGYDLDGECTENRATSVCRQDGITAFVADGADGVDNAFGVHILPVVRDFVPDLEAQVQGRMAGGETLVVRLADWSGTRNDVDFFFSISEALSIGEPRWDARDSYVLDEDAFLEDETPRIADAAAYVADGVVVGRIPDRQPITLPWVDGSKISLPLLSGRFTAELSADLSRLERAVIQGRISTFDIRRMWDDAGFCEGTDARRALDAALQRALDGLINEGVGGDPFCDTISIALEFRGERIGEVERDAIDRAGQCE